jgi:tRNA A37 threonylcarbamoyladenosine synthetase subunit TsaC/SUA5/YrdC
MIYLIPTDTCYGMACEIADSNEYNKIYEIKQRYPQKHLAIMVGDTMWLRANTDLNFDQLDFLTKYPRPFTVVTRSRIMSHLIHFKDEYLDFHNSDIYDKIGFRVANNEAETKLIEEV